MSAPIYDENESANLFLQLVGDDLTVSESAMTGEETVDPETEVEVEEPVDPETEVEVEEPVDPETEVEVEEPVDPETEVEDPEDPEAIDLTSVEDLEKIGLSVDALMSLRHKVKVGDKEFDLTLGEALTGATEVRKKALDLEQSTQAARRQYEAEAQARTQELYREHEDLAKQIAAVKLLKQQALGSEEMKRLEEIDPARAVLAQRRLEQEIGEIDQLVQTNAAQFQAFQAQQRTQWAQAEFAELKKSVPDWGSDHQQRVGSLLESYGFPVEEIRATADHRMLRLLNDFATVRAERDALAKKADANTEAAKRAVAKVKKTPIRVPKAKAPVSAKKVASAARARQFKKLTQTGDPADAVPLFMAALEDA